MTDKPFSRHRPIEEKRMAYIAIEQRGHPFGRGYWFYSKDEARAQVSEGGHVVAVEIEEP